MNRKEEKNCCRLKATKIRSLNHLTIKAVAVISAAPARKLIQDVR